MLTRFRSAPSIWLTLLILALTVCAGSAFADPPSRVARISVLRGDVSFTPAGEDDWHAANLNRPLVSGDKLHTDRDARVELDLGAASVRLDERSGVSMLELDDRTARFELAEGTLNLHVRKLYGDQRYEVDTPTLVFVISQPGEYRIDIAAQGDTTHVTVFDGAGEVFGEGGARYRVNQRQSYRFDDSRLRDVAVQDLPRPDDFDNWCFARDERYDNALSRRYVSDEVIGAADLDDYGAWDDMPSYGSIWFPARVATGWAPYRSGHWAWIDPWGWTWVDDAPWGFAPFHYGRWIYVGNRWGWLPGPVALRPVYAPALVVFIGGSNWRTGYAPGGAPVGWCPLGPRDVYVPPYRASRGYFTHVNASNTPMIDRDRLNRSYENYAHGRPAHDRDYAYRHNPAAVTAVSRETFLHARPVAAGRLHLKDKQLTHAEIAPTIAPSPIAAGFASDDKKAHQRNDGQSVESRDTTRQRVPADDPSQKTVPPRDRERNTGQSAVERALRSRETSPVEPRNASERPANQRDNVLTDDRRRPPAIDFAREHYREAPAPVEPHNDASPSDDNHNRTLQRHTRREPSDTPAAPVDLPQVVPAAPTSHRERRTPENAAPPAHQPTPRNQRPTAQEQTPEVRRVRTERDKNARHDSEDETLESDEPGR